MTLPPAAQAEFFARLGWLTWLYPLFILGYAPNAPWDRPGLAIPAFVVLTTLWLCLSASWYRHGRDAHRWLADPPGPPRDMPPPHRLARLIRWLFAVGGVLLIGGVAALVN